MPEKDEAGNGAPSKSSPVQQASPEEVLRDFGIKLEVASVQYVDGDRWTGAQSACAAVAQFIFQHSGGRRPDLAAPFLAMVEGFKDLKDGKDPEIFSRKASPQKRARSREFAHLKRWTAAILEILMEYSVANVAADVPKGETQIAAYIARHASRWNSFSGAELSATKVMNYRKAEKASDVEKRRLFEAICDALRCEPDQTFLRRVLAKGPPGIPKS